MCVPGGKKNPRPSYTALTLYKGKQRKWLGPSHTTLFQPITNRGAYSSQSHDEGKGKGSGRRGKIRSVVVRVIALVECVHGFGGGASERRGVLVWQQSFAKIDDRTFNFAFVIKNSRTNHLKQF